MVRKRVSVSELIQEEAQKFIPPEGESAIEVTAEAIVEENVLVAGEPPTQTPQSTTVKQTDTAKADLEATIKDFQETLKQANHNSAAFQQEVVGLQSSISEQKALTERLTKDLHEAKKTALQLAEANSQLVEEINSLKQEKASFTEANSQLVEEINSLKQEKASFTEANSQLVEEINSLKPPEKETSKLVKEPYNPVNYRKSHRSSIKLAQTQPDEYEDTSSQMWLLD
jgi:chromosome segregation ATPase